MQITKIQNIVRNGFQHKNNSIKFNSVNFKGQDVFERTTTDNTVVSKKYYRGEKEYTTDILMQSGDRLFIKNKDSYIPYGACLDEYNANNELIRHTAYNNGAKYIVDLYKNGKLIQEDKYEDVYARGKEANKRTSVRKFETSCITGKPELTFQILRNYGKDWIKHPRIKLQKKVNDDVITIHFSAQSEEKVGDTYVRSLKDPVGTSIPIIDDNIYRFTPKNKEEVRLLFNALSELKETIESQEFKVEFGNNDKFNSELDNAIKFLNSKLNED